MWHCDRKIEEEGARQEKREQCLQRASELDPVASSYAADRFRSWAAETESKVLKLDRTKRVIQSICTLMENDKGTEVLGFKITDTLLLRVASVVVSIMLTVILEVAVFSEL